MRRMAIALGLAALIAPVRGQASDLGNCEFETAAQFEACRTAEQAAYRASHAQFYPFGGRMVRDLNATGSYRELVYYPREGGPGITLSQATLNRERVRCEASVGLLYVNDALGTRQELFDQCMNLQLSLLR